MEGCEKRRSESGVPRLKFRVLGALKKGGQAGNRRCREGRNEALRGIHLD